MKKNEDKIKMEDTIGNYEYIVNLLQYGEKSIKGQKKTNIKKRLPLIVIPACISIAFILGSSIIGNFAMFTGFYISATIAIKYGYDLIKNAVNLAKKHSVLINISNLLNGGFLAKEIDHLYEKVVSDDYNYHKQTLGRINDMLKEILVNLSKLEIDENYNNLINREIDSVNNIKLDKISIRKENNNDVKKYYYNGQVNESNKTISKGPILKRKR